MMDSAVADTGYTGNFEYRRQLYEVYQQERRHLAEAEGALDHAVTTAVLTISGGALGISLTVVKDFNLLAAAAASNLLAAAWTLLVVALLGSLVALKCNQETHSRYLTILDEEMAREFDGAFERARRRQRACWLRRVLRIADWVSVVFCLIGTALLFMFVYTLVANGVASDAHTATSAHTIPPPNRTQAPDHA